MKIFQISTGFIGEKVLKQIGMKYLTIVSALLKCISTCMLSTVNGPVSFAGWMTVLAVAFGLTCSTSVSVLGLIFGDHLSNAIGFVTLLLMIGTATPPATQILCRYLDKFRIGRCYITTTTTNATTTATFTTTTTTTSP
ncbi:uncharacterized protein LOC117121319 [Anneissia japonica]|uniref:uncharacterized protein LOC117121319 n=1 Tax=Anneissia japonica TaxID=1529436 RepID=UPI0014255CA4|nr:uncharacterized protein LOC117121319 [Anneissia japonica]